MVIICPLVINWAMPRPATIKTRVATIGWMFALDTSKPFHTPLAVKGLECPASGMNGCNEWRDRSSVEVIVMRGNGVTY